MTSFGVDAYRTSEKELATESLNSVVMVAVMKLVEVFDG
jgi:hypothetical protein